MGGPEKIVGLGDAWGLRGELEDWPQRGGRRFHYGNRKVRGRMSEDTAGFGSCRILIYSFNFLYKIQDGCRSVGGWQESY